MVTRWKEKDEVNGLKKYKKLRYTLKGDNTMIRDLLVVCYTASYYQGINQLMRVQLPDYFTNMTVDNERWKQINEPPIFTSIHKQ